MMNFNGNDTAVVFIDPQNEVLSETGAAWSAVGASVRENRTIENMERLFEAAKRNAFEVFISPHYFYPTDRGWKFNGPLETSEIEDRMFARRGPSPSTAFPARAPTGSSASSPTSRTARRSSSVRTGSGAPRRTTSRCSYASAASPRSSRCCPPTRG